MLSKYSQMFVTNRPSLKRNTNTVYFIVFFILIDFKHSFMYFNAL